VASGNIEKADEYLQKFAVLMRTTLDFSEIKWISLKEELNYIRNYLALEKLRFNQFFDHEIKLDNDIEDSQVQLPPMLLQPFIENAIRHGIRPKKNGKGYLVISFLKDISGITIIIDDNGIGFKTSLGLKTMDEIHYQSKGMNLSKQRATLQGIDVKVVDKENSDGISQGTQVILKIKNRA
jgi:LytS/YehU family sensor histidine kinase